MKCVMKYLPFALLMFSSLVFGAEDCSVIKNTEERLACFDRMFPSAEPATVAPEPNTEVNPEISSESVPELDAPQPNGVAVGTSVATKTESASITETPVEPSQGSSSSFFAKRDPDFTATVKDILNKDQRKMAFLLSNEQIWLQTTPRNLPIYAGDEVTVKKGTIGGFIMRNTSGTSTRVRRIH